MESFGFGKPTGKAALTCKNHPLKPNTSRLSLESYSELFEYFTANRSKQAAELYVENSHSCLALVEVLKLHGLSASSLTKEMMLQRIIGVELFNPFRCTEADKNTRPVFEQSEIEQDLAALGWQEKTSLIEEIIALPRGVVSTCEPVINTNLIPPMSLSVATTVMSPAMCEFPMLNEGQILQNNYKPLTKASVVSKSIPCTSKGAAIFQNTEAIFCQEDFKADPEHGSVPRSTVFSARSDTLISSKSLQKRKKCLSIFRKYKALKFSKEERQATKPVCSSKDVSNVERRESA